MDKTALEQLLSSYNWWMGVSTVAVAVGILGEYVAHFIFEKEARKNKCEMALSIVFGILVLGGVVGEYIFGKNLSQVSGQLQQLSDNEVAQANERSTNNEKEAARLRSEAALIQQSLAWRTFGDGCSNLLKSRLKQFNETTFSVWYDAGDSEGGTFAWQIATSLHNAKRNVFSPGSFSELTQGGRPFDLADASLDTGIEIASTHDSTSRDAAALVRRTLEDCGFDAHLGGSQTQSGQGVVWINVKSRPTGPQGEAKLALVKVGNHAVH